jgi:hypothetical protein
MPLRTVSNTGGNWNATTTWVGGVVPIAGDTVDFTATSGQLTVNVASTCIGINFTNYVNTITFTALLTINGPINLGTGGYTQAGGSGIQANATATHTSNGVVWSRLWAFAGISQTFTLADNFNFTGSLNFNGVTSIIINGNTINTRSILSTTTALTSGTTNIVFNGTGTWSNTSTGILRNNITINTAETLTISGNVYYNTGTLTYTLGTVVTTGSTLNISLLSTTLNTSTVIWNNVSIVLNGLTNIITLSSNLNVTGTLTLTGGVLSFSGAGLLNPSGPLIISPVAVNFTLTIPNNLTITNLTLTGAVNSTNTINGNIINVTGNLTVSNGGTAINSGTTNINLIGTGTWSHTVTGVIRNNLTINTSGTITIGTNIYYNTGTLTYTTGSVVTTGSLLTVSTNTTLNTNTLNWNNVVISGGTQTLTSDLNISGNLTLQTSNPIINGLFNVNVGGNLAVNVIVTGTATIVLNGTGTWTHLNSSSTLLNNITINTFGTITISGIIYYSSSTISYTTGTVITTGSTLTITSGTISTNTMLWNNITFATNGSFTMAIGSDLYLNGTFLVGGAGTINGAFNVYCVNYTINNSTSGTTSVTVTMPQTIYVYNTLTFGFSSSGTGSLGAIFYVNKNLSLGNGGANTGTSQVIMTGTGTITGTNIFNHPLTFNSPGLITIPISLTTTTTVLTYINGYINASTATLTCGNISTPQTLINMHKIVWKTVIVTSNSTLIMNEFFSGKPSIKTSIAPSSTTNYTITFQNGFEKISKFVDIKNCTLSKPLQLLVITNSKKSSSNTRGIKYINQSPNGIAKGKPSIQTPTTFGTNSLVHDPNM